MQAIFERRSIRNFSGEPIPHDMIASVLEAARAAPSAKNRQPWKFIVFTGAQKAALLECMERGLAREAHGEPVLPQSRAGLADARGTRSALCAAPPSSSSC